ncbi:aldehyde dehydrogenase family, putative [Trypanosoma cruzi marinkellei]|uniref:Aldehyde dehydrogenase n=1 Tax=Trypanosoma cruzi marinkellei TaxID=85056 RepID=K2MRC3_TRYCR|nr:aldehyde dehydrogenase family, putative [Trypanosoma cruzi marinkellei]
MSPSVVNTPIEKIPLVVSRCRNGFRTGAMRSLEQRKEILRSFLRMLDENEEAFCRAVHSDLRKHPTEAKLAEISVLRVEVHHFLQHLDEYASPEKPQMEGIFRLEDCEIHRDPLGVVLVIGSWNYPLLLTLLPLVGALAAGNTVVAKPSDLAPASAEVMHEILPKYIPDSIVGFVKGGVSETTRLLEERFDYIFYTGNLRVAKIVMTAAAKQLTPVTLELGGKSPVIVDASCESNLGVVARRIMWGKVLNAGQTCIAPDYVLVHRQIKAKLIEALKEARDEMMGANPLQNQKDYSAIVNVNHFDRLVGLFKGGTLAFGGEMDRANRTIAPAVLTNVQLEHQIMTEEIFGPLLPLLPFDTVTDVLQFLGVREKPLALYIFADDKSFVSKVIKNSFSGAVLVNDVVLHVAPSSLPFGGVGHSGMGAYRGKFSFETFSHKKSVMRRKMGLEFLNAPRYPPYTLDKFRVFRHAVELSVGDASLNQRLRPFSDPARFVALGSHFIRYLMKAPPKK